MSTAVMDTVRYSSDGQLLDIHRAAAADAPTVLLWHGRGPAERDVLGALAAEVARLGATVIVPDWHPDAPDGGRPHLEASLRFTWDYVRDPAKVVLVGWSLGGRAAMATALRPDPPEGWRPAAVVGIAARYNQPEPLLGLPSPMAVCAAAPPLPIHLVHGTADRVCDFANAQEFQAVLAACGRPAPLTVLTTDHSGAVMAEYASELGRCRPAHSGSAHREGLRTARVIAEAAGLRTREDHQVSG
ncbi:alpha/beta hydrolase [Streptomyces phaeochromogenes]|uniref:alpha/beta hydrolase n=1 Tax=Streptomyces phaeochromogenes TaxID=1923 RepID=UPI0033E2043B|nr:alpha/beta hydrolase [Streptomyces phaeochromogenes]WTA05097.1 alpha/beta hydrolase [Streptomyces phaeochromogenes]